MIGAAMISRSPMRRSLLLALALLTALAVAGCTSKPESGSKRGTADSPSAQPNEEAAKRPPIVRNYDVEGRLLPSDDYVVGIPLPRGAKLFRESELEHVYRILAPIDKVLAYFGPMMITGNVERRGKGAIYKRASVRGAEVNPTKVNVSILELGRSLTRISVTELPPPPKHVPSSDQTKAAAKESFRRLD